MADIDPLIIWMMGEAEADEADADVLRRRAELIGVVHADDVAAAYVAAAATAVDRVKSRNEHWSVAAAIGAAQSCAVLPDSFEHRSLPTRQAFANHAADIALWFGHHGQTAEYGSDGSKIIFAAANAARAAAMMDDIATRSQWSDPESAPGIEHVAAVFGFLADSNTGSMVDLAHNVLTVFDEYKEAR